MKQVLLILLILALIIGRVLWVKEAHPGQWSIVFDNYQDTESVGELVAETISVFRGIRVSRAPMSVREANKVIYKWTDKYGQVHMNYQLPPDVKDYETVRLGDLKFDIDKSLSKEEKEALLKGGQ
ncbi:DUF4124 domain-containing protein [Pleionea sp. CnH1-48]|uniref:DUF4124 domain-containing protein n=1 Tax=Pleionea sp. CnH1-48 TaxID=2954494 RepID=UPI002096C043|nr:DUF4124 domain-containing protein [Pleionea sp. CnH1-48]MCO7225317.1 DUF4124 domain-containing protein [Pleionea sp. CnH1-48]